MQGELQQGVRLLHRGGQVPDRAGAPRLGRKQTTVNAERYISQGAARTLEHTILSAQDKVVALEYQLFCQLKEQTCAHVAQIQKAAAAVAQVDVLTSFAVVAAVNGYCMPQVDGSDSLSISEGRHPVVEKVLPAGTPFVPNDTHMDSGEDLCAIITGPNMAGKSTYMRQVALIVLMAQMGSFVPARSARIGVVDRVFTRIGASDDLGAGQSTFMVEMTEVAQMLRDATSRSLLILDEIGRGTSTYDGMSIARAVLEFCADKKRLGAKTLFATHYHELTAVEAELDGVRNYHIAVKKRKDDIVFLRKIVPGGADQSYGIEVAKLAGVPDRVISRARDILAQLEAEGRATPSAGQAAPAEDQLSLGDMAGAEVLDALRAGAMGYGVRNELSVDRLRGTIWGMVCGEVVFDGSIRTHLQEALRSSDGQEPAFSDADPGLMKLLTQREREILCLLMDGLSNQEVATRLFISEPTVKKNVSRIIDKLQVQNRVQAAVYAARHLPR